MGKTTPPASMVLMGFRRKISVLRQMMSSGNFALLNDLFGFAQMHVAEVQYTADPLPEQIFLLAMILEVHKEFLQCEEEFTKMKS